METPASPSSTPSTWLLNQPYFLLCLPSLFWAGNAVIGRLAAGHVTPITLSFSRWLLAFLLILPFAWTHLTRDWPAIRARLPLMALLSATGIGAFNTLQYISLQYTTALNVLLLQPIGPFFVAIWSFVLVRIRLSVAQALGMLVSICGVLTILTQGHLDLLTNITLNRGDLLFILALLIFGVYSVLSFKRPAIHPLSFASFTFGAGAASILPFFLWELTTPVHMDFTWANWLTIAYVAIFPSLFSYLCYNRVVEMLGANRAALSLHLVPVFGSVLAIVFLGERPTAFHFVGYALVLCGIAVAARGPKRAVIVAADTPRSR